MYQWEILSKYDEKTDLVDLILKNRGYKSAQERKIFLNPPPVSYWFKRLPKEFLLSLRQARELIKKAVNEKRAIIVHGDYDVDGICATAILTKALKETLEHENVFPFIPNRFEHGYGLSEKSIKASLGELDGDLVKKGALFITVDSGITSQKEISYLVENGHQVIVTDHHQKPKKLPPADVIVWYDQVVGTTISWLLSRVIGDQDEQSLAFCCLATITDLQPVENFNRTLVKEGLEILNNKPPLGIKALLETAGKRGDEVTTYDLGWLIGPRLNATGRVEDATQSLKLLLEKDPEKAKEIAWELNKVNSQRQDKTLEMYELAAEFEEENLPQVIISHHENYHEGIIGLVASRLVKKYYRPSIVVSTSEDVYKGSVRSIPGVNIIEFLREMEDLFVSLGGHPMAAGFSIKEENFSLLVERVSQDATHKIDPKHFTRILEIDVEIPGKIIDLTLIEKLDKLRPYGLGNSQPVFATRSLDVAKASWVGRENQHLSLRLFDGDNFHKAIFFNAEDYKLDLSEEDKVNLAYTLKENYFNGRTTVDLVVKDLKKLG